MADPRLKSIVDRMVRLEEERREVAEQIKDIAQEAKSAGYNAKAVKAAVKRQMETAEQRKAREELAQDLDLIMAALGEYANTPLGKRALEVVA